VSDIGPYDICLWLPFSPGEDIVLRVPCAEGGVGRRPRRALPPYLPPEQAPAVARTLYRDLIERYGTRVGPAVFEAMAQERKGPFAPGAKYDLDKPSVERKVKRAGGLIPDPLEGGERQRPT
jgi:hypothetical protein